MPAAKVFVGRKIRDLRMKAGVTQAVFAEKLNISTSYLNQIEMNHRPVSAAVLMALAEKFGADVASLASSDADRLMVAINEVLADPMFKSARPSSADLKHMAQNAPEFGKALLHCHQAYQRLSERLASLDDQIGSLAGGFGANPYDEVRDFFHFVDNYVDRLDRAAEQTASKIGLGDRGAGEKIAKYLADRHKIKTRYDDIPGGLLRSYDATSRLLTLNSGSPAPTAAFQSASVLGQLEMKSTIAELVEHAGFQTNAARDICTIGLVNYYAGALMMPYEEFRLAAGEVRHDIEVLAAQFGASIEQVAHRLSTLQRPDNRGLPIFFARVDRAGNITKRHSAAKLQFARYGAACPLWNVHSAFESPGRIIRQLAETPDGARYLCIATEVRKGTLGFQARQPTFALALGCEVTYAKQFVYSDGLDLHKVQDFDQIGISCRICERPNCYQRAVPPLNSDLKFDHSSRAALPYQL